MLRRIGLLGLACVASRVAAALGPGLGRRSPISRPSVSLTRLGLRSPVLLARMSAGAGGGAAPRADEKLAALRAEMTKAGVGALIVPSGDAHLSEYVHPHYSRREFVCGFSGSAGTVLVTKNHALLWTDGRYFLQAEGELGPEWQLMRSGEPGVPTLHEWVSRELPEGTGVGIDPSVFSVSEATALREALTGADRSLELVSMPAPNLVDSVWDSGRWERPPPPAGEARSMPIEVAGVGRSEKLAAAAAASAKEGASSLLVCMLDEVAWLLNVRGSDVPHCPVLQAYVIVPAARSGAAAGVPGAAAGGAARLFVDASKLPAALAEELLRGGVSVEPYGSVEGAVRALVQAGGRVMLDPAKVNFALRVAAGEAALEQPSPLSMPKAMKNDAELAGMLSAHLKDGAALATFFSWLERHVLREGGTPTEADIARHVARARAAQGAVDLSFPTIAGCGANGAIIHYDCSKALRPAVFDGSQLLLLDSGGQYAEGTTDGAFYSSRVLA